MRYPRRRADRLLANKVGYCRDFVDRLAFAMRSVGIPVAVDYIRVSPDNGGSHMWCVVRDNRTGRMVPFSDNIKPLPERTTVFDSGRMKGKVHRMLFDRTTGEMWTDVTAEYFGDNQVRVNVNSFDGPALLGVFLHGKWVDIDKGEKIGSTIKFEDLEPGVFFAPIDKNGNTVGFPFSVNKEGHTEVYKPDSAHMQTVRLTRKKPLTRRINEEWLGQNVVGLIVEAASSSSFEDAIKVVDIDSPMNTNYNLCVLPHPVECSYLRLRKKNGGVFCLSEIKVFTVDNHEIKMSTIDDLESIWAPNLFDGDILNNFYLPESMNHLDMKLRQPSHLSSVLLVPRNDDNFVWPGDTYELMCHYGPDGWKSLGCKVAQGPYIDFDAPYGALLWLRDHTRGQEEQCFIVRDGRQMFCSNPQFIKDL